MSTIDIIKKQKEYTSLDKELYEHNVLIEDEVKFKREFVGLVDKVIYRKTPNHDYIAVIDYKSGYIKSTIDNVEDGFNLQLPIYAYMLKKSTKFNNPIVLGIFLQKILHATPKYDSKKSREQIENENLLLQGYAIGTDNIEMLDKTYEESKLIAKMKLNSKGDIDRYARVLTEDEFEDLATTVEELMSNAYNKIEDMNFEINPKIIKKENKSCTYCKYESICYKRIEDNVYIESEDKADVNELD